MNGILGLCCRSPYILVTLVAENKAYASGTILTSAYRGKILTQLTYSLNYQKVRRFLLYSVLRVSEYLSHWQ